MKLACTRGRRSLLGTVGVGVGDSVGVGVLVAVQVPVGVSAGSGVSLGVAVADGVSVTCGVLVNVPVGVSLAVGVAEAVLVGELVSVGVGVQVPKGVLLGVKVGPDSLSFTSTIWMYSSPSSRQSMRKSAPDTPLRKRASVRSKTACLQVLELPLETVLIPIPLSESYSKRQESLPLSK